MTKPLDITYDADMDIVTIDRVHWSGNLFRVLGRDTPAGVWFRIHVVVLGADTQQEFVDTADKLRPRRVADE